MDISREEAQTSLADIATVTDTTRKVTDYAGTDIILGVWGVLWTVGFVQSHLLAGPGSAHVNQAGFVWLLLVSIGIVASLVLGKRYRAPVENPAGKRVGYFWFALYAYAWLVMAMLCPFIRFQGVPDYEIGRFMCAINCVIPMFAYVVMGLWLEQRFLLRMGLGLTAAIAVGYFVLPALFYLWMAVIGGGSFLGSAGWMRFQWLRAMRSVPARESGHA